MSWLTDVENELTKVAVGTRAADAEKGILGNFFSAKTFSYWISLHFCTLVLGYCKMFLTAFADYGYLILLNRFTVDTHITHKDRDIIYTLLIYMYITPYIINIVHII